MKILDQSLKVVQPESFLQLIERERARVNRNGSKFTLVLLQLADAVEKNEEVQADVFNAIMERIRTIDQLGIYDEEHIGLLLPQTDRNGAVRIIDDLSRNAKLKNNVSSFRMYCYP